jgi:hypothetical protein
MRDGRKKRWNLAQICQWVCPAIDVDLYAANAEGREIRIVKANDWMTIPGGDLIKRITGPLKRGTKKVTESIRIHGANVSPLTDGAGRILGRACVFLNDDALRDGIDKGAVVVGGLRSLAISHAAGIFVGLPLRASRDVAFPSVTAANLALWASDQARVLIRSGQFDDRALAEAAQIVRTCRRRHRRSPDWVLAGRLPVAC